jgi:hypothetical protein
MKKRYFEKLANDYDPNHGRQAFYNSTRLLGDEQPFERASHINGENQLRADFIEKIWKRWVGLDFVVGPHYVASWRDRPVGFAMHKVWCPNSYIDRCVIENDDTGSYVLFDLAQQNRRNETEYRVFDVYDYCLTDEDETLIRLSI